MPDPPAATWSDFDTELDHWTAEGRRAGFWWRDDDAVTATPALDRLLAIADDTPIALAVIPAEAREALARRLDGVTTVNVVQHGWRHANHAPAGDKKSELGLHRPLRVRLEELAHGRDRLAALFGTQALPVLTPPWNRLAADLVPHLPKIGFRGLSTIGPRPAAELLPGLRVVNTHVDLLNWANRRGCIGETAALGAIVDHLVARRLGEADPDEPTGLLTHHLVQDAATGEFLRRFVTVARRHPAAALLTASPLFQAP
jgi:hypothetical protein